MEAGIMLELQNLSRSFRSIPAIQKVSFKPAPGEIVGFLGPNGAGKSTTVKIITGMLRPNDGRVLFEGQDIRKDMVAFRSVLGYVPEEAISITTFRDWNTCNLSVGCAEWERRSSRPRLPVCLNSFILSRGNIRQFPPTPKECVSGC